MMKKGSLLNLSRRRFMQAGAAAAVAAGFPTIIASRGLAAEGTRSVALQLSWLPNSNQLGEVTAMRLGFFEEESIDLTMHPGGPSNNGVSIMASGQHEIGLISGTTNFMLAVAQELPLKAFACGLQKHPFVFISLAKNPIRKPEDFKGKKVGLGATSIIQLRAVLAQNGIDESEVQIVRIGNEMTPLLTGQVDAVSTWLTNTTAINNLGSDVELLTLWDSGVKLYANAYYATHDTLASERDMLGRFIRAVARGWAYAYDNRDEAVELLVKEYSNLDAKGEREAADVILAHAFNEDTQAHGWGTMADERWAGQIGLMSRLGQLPRKPAVEEVATLELLGETQDARPKLG